MELNRRRDKRQNMKKKKKKLGKRSLLLNEKKAMSERNKKKRIIRKDMNEGMKEEKLNEKKEIKMIIYFPNIEREMNEFMNKLSNV